MEKKGECIPHFGRLLFPTPSALVSERASGSLSVALVWPYLFTLVWKGASERPYCRTQAHNVQQAHVGRLG